MSYEDDSGYGQGKTTGYGDDSGGGYGGQKTSGYGDDTQGGYGAQGGDNTQGGYGQKATSYGDDGGYGRGTGTGSVGTDDFQNSQFNKEDVENLKDRTDIDDDEREARRKKLMEEVAGGVVGAGVLGFAGYEAYEHFNKGDGSTTAADAGQQTNQAQPEKKDSWF